MYFQEVGQMELRSRKKLITNFTTNEGPTCYEMCEQNREVQAATDANAATFPILELPTLLVYSILSRLPLKTIFLSRCVCKKFLELLKDPYFAQTHLAQSPTSTNLICLNSKNDWGFLYFYMFDPEETSITTSCSIDPTHGPQYPPHSLTKRNAEFCFRYYKLAVVGSCNGLLCLYSASERPFYMVCNPLLEERVILPAVTPSTPSYTYYNKSAFGFSSKTKQYKVLRFMSLQSVDPVTKLTTTKRVLEIHTLGSDSWRRIDDSPCLELRETFDPCLSSALHWTTDGQRKSNLICSFDLETECFKYLPPPCHFNQQFIGKISWISTGILSGCLCLCYVYENAQFAVWRMNDYGVEESWINVCKVDMKFYCGLKVEDLSRPLKFMKNGDLLLICSSNTLLAYSPTKGTFREYKTLEYWSPKVIAHIPSFISLEHAAAGDNVRVERVSMRKPMQTLDLL